MRCKGSLPTIIRNTDGLYVGNLVVYFRVVFCHAQNLLNPYHNFRHMFHVLWQCYNACIYYKTLLIPREMRNILIAAIFHDFDHSGLFGNDDLNIERSVRAFKKYVVEEDKPFIDDIVVLMRATEFPYNDHSRKIGLSGAILRDADMTQALDTSWIQQVVFGLATEWRKDPIEIIRSQEAFLRQLKFHTEWAYQLFPQTEIEAKIQEGRELLALLEGPLPT